MHCCRKKSESSYQSKPRGPRLVGKSTQLLRDMSVNGCAFQDDAALDVVGKGYVDDTSAVDSSKTNKPTRNKQLAQRGL